MLQAGFEPAVPTSEQPPIYALDCAATGIASYSLPLNDKLHSLVTLRQVGLHPTVPFRYVRELICVERLV